MAARRVTTAAIFLLAGMLSASCSWVSGIFGDDDEQSGTATSVFDLDIGDCFLAPDDVRAELSEVQQVDCTVPHQQELYDVITYTAAESTDDYPGNTALDTFAQGACAESFSDYVGIDYQDSGLWMTYLLPSPRSWQQGSDRAILCFVTTTTGDELSLSVRGSRQ